MSTRPVRYELHIRPLIRLLDRDNMAWAFDLWDYDQTRANADAILRRAAADMPPVAYGGPWPEEWLALFQRWKDEGFQRLDIGVADAPGYTARRNGDTVTITARGTAPTPGYRAWLDVIAHEGQPREYIHYWEPPAEAQPAAPTPFRVKAVLKAPESLTEIAVVDRVGRHSIAVSI